MSEEYSEESSATPDESPVVEETSSQEVPHEASEQKAQTETVQEEKPAPFHEHPRFKELIEQNRAFKEQSEKSQQDYYRLQGQLEAMQRAQAPTPKKEDPVDPFIRDLEKINPEYAKTIKNLATQAAKAEAVERQFQQYQNQQFAEKAYSHFDNLLASNKVADANVKDVYKSAVEAEVYRREARGEKLGLKDLDSIFSSFHSKYSKYQEENERAILARYATSKKADQAPTSVTGGAATSPVMKKFASLDSPDTIKWVADQLRASKKQL